MKTERLSPRLRERLSSQAPCQGSGGRLRTIIVAKDNFLAKMLRIHPGFDVGSHLPFCAGALPLADIALLQRERGWIHGDLDVPEKILHRPLKATGTLNADVTGRYRVPPLSRYSGKGLTILLPDTGCTDHPAIPANLVDYRNLVEDESTPRDYYGHGTFIAGQWLSRDRNHPGLCPDVHVISARIFGRQGATRPSRILKAIDLGIREKVHILNTSYGSPVSRPYYEMAYREAQRKGILICSSAGNGGPREGTVCFPAAYPFALSVGAVDKKGDLADFSARALPGDTKSLNLVAPGVNIVSARSPDGNMGAPVGSGFTMASGTSFASPVIAGLAALVAEACGDWNAAKVRQIILEACDHP